MDADSKPSDAPLENSGVDPRYVVPGLSRGLALLQLFSSQHPRQTLVELTAGLQITRSAAYRLVYTLEKDGFIIRDPETRRYQVTAKVLSLGFVYLASQGIVEVAQPFLKKLSDETRASCYLVILNGARTHYIARVAPPANVVSNLQIGSSNPAYLTASGRMLIAHLSEPEFRDLVLRTHGEYAALHPPILEDFRRQAEDDRKRGYLYRASLIDPGITSCACAIRDHTKKAVAAVAVIGPDHVLAQAGGESEISRLLQLTTADISRHLGYQT